MECITAPLMLLGTQQGTLIGRLNSLFIVSYLILEPKKTQCENAVVKCRVLP